MVVFLLINLRAFTCKETSLLSFVHTQICHYMKNIDENDLVALYLRHAYALLL